MGMLKNYLKIALRNLERHKFYSIANVLGLAIGLGAFLLILLFVRWELSFENTHSKKERIYRVLTIDRALGTHEQRVGITIPPLGPLLPSSFPEIQSSLRLSGGGKTLFKYREQPSVYARQLRSADPNFFEFFDFPLLEGDPQKALSQPFQVVLTETLARKIFGDTSAMGKVVETGFGKSVKVTGIMKDLPANSHLDFDGLLSLATSASLAKENRPKDSKQPIWLENWQMIAMPTYILLKPGTEPGDLDRRITQLCRKNGVKENFDITLQGLKDVHLRGTDVIFESATNKGDVKILYIFGAIALLIILIAIINYINLSTAQSTQRAKEVGMRKVVGSLRGQIQRQFLVESILISLFAVILALPLVRFTLPWLNQMIGGEITLDSLTHPVMMVGLLMMVGCIGVLAGVYPAFVLSQFKPVSVLKGHFKSSRVGVMMRKGLVVFQFTLSIALIVATLLVDKQMRYIQQKDLGYNREQVMVFDMADNEQAKSMETFRQQLLGSSMFVQVGVSTHVPGRTFGRTGVKPEGTSDKDIYIWSSMAVSPEILPTLGMKIVSGRNFDRIITTDPKEAVLINEAAARHLDWTQPLGKKLYFGPDRKKVFSVVGVVKDFHFITLHQPIEPVVVFMLDKNPGNLVAARVQPGQVDRGVEFAKKCWTQVFPNHPFAFTFLDDEFHTIYTRDMNTHTIIRVLSILAIFIACLGLFSLSSYTITMRTKEIGVRKVLGASAFTLIRQLVMEFVQLVIWANFIAWPLAWYASTQWLRTFAYRTAIDWQLFFLAGILGIFIAVLTVLTQAWLAANTNPAQALSYE